MAAKDRSMATGPYPTRVLRGKVTHTTGSRVTRITYIPIVVLSDGTKESCDHSHGHTSEKALLACANKLVDRLNAAAGIPKNAR